MVDGHMIGYGSIPGRYWKVEENCTHFAMESTDIYRVSAHETLDTTFDGHMSLIVDNERHMKNVPGKKTDMKDTEWIVTLSRAGLLNGSFIPKKRYPGGQGPHKIS